VRLALVITNLSNFQIRENIANKKFGKLYKLIFKKSFWWEQ